MRGYNVYIFFLCLIVFILLVVVLGFLITILLNCFTKLIYSGMEDKNLIKDYEDRHKHKKSKRVEGWSLTSKIISLTLCSILGILFVFSLYMTITQNNKVGMVPDLKVVKSASMAKKHEQNKYLVENDLNNQFQVNDMIVLRELPKEEDIELYDIIMYERDDILIIHRIVKIEEPNSEHTERLFTFQGDDVASPDNKPVKYSQMKGIYKNQRIPYIGSFFLFMQSPAGYLCLILVIVATITMPVVDKKITKAKIDRLVEIGVIKNQSVEYKEKSEKFKKNKKEKSLIPEVKVLSSKQLKQNEFNLNKKPERPMPPKRPNINDNQNNKKDN